MLPKMNFKVQCYSSTGLVSISHEIIGERPKRSVDESLRFIMIVLHEILLHFGEVSSLGVTSSGVLYLFIVQMSHAMEVAK